jgi:hypothetical protein
MQLIDELSKYKKMHERGIRLVNIIYVIAIVAADLFVYMILGILMMGYDDNYDASQGNYGSFSSMSNNDALIYIGFQVWNIMNLILIVFYGYRFFKWLKVNSVLRD